MKSLKLSGLLILLLISILLAPILLYAPATMPSEELPRSYVRHRPESTLLYKVVQSHWGEFLKSQASSGLEYPGFVKNVFFEYLKCGIPEHGFIRTYCKSCRASGVVAFSCKLRGFCPSCHARRQHELSLTMTDFLFPHIQVRQWVLSLPFRLRYQVAHSPKLISMLLKLFIQAVNVWYRKKAKELFGVSGEIGAVTFIQRFGSHLNLNPHFHVLYADGVFCKAYGEYTFHQVPGPSKGDLEKLVSKISKKAQQKLDFIDDGAEDPAERDGLSVAKGISTLAVQGFIKVFDEFEPLQNQQAAGFEDPYSAKKDGFSLNAKVSIPRHKRDKLKKLIRYVARGPFANSRFQECERFYVYSLKTPWRNGATHVTFTGTSLLQRLVALIPPPRANLVRYHGVFAPNFKDRKLIVPEKPAKSATEIDSGKNKNRILWAELIRRTFALDVTVCPKCKGRIEPIAVIKDPQVIFAILGSIGERTKFSDSVPIRGPPQTEQFAMKFEDSQDQRPTNW